MRSSILLGSRGYDYDHWAGHFYPADLPRAKRLEFYSERFPTVLMHDSFHQMPSREELVAWRESTPEFFRFSFVAPRLITWERKLEGAEGEVERVFEELGILGDRLGVLVLVLPRELRIHVSLLDRFLSKVAPLGRIAVEFNSIDWYVERTRETLERHDVAASIQDSPECVAPWWITAGHVLLRRYGSRGKGAGRYTSDEIRRLAERIREDVLPEKTVFLYFENEVQGYSVEHAALLRKILCS